MSGELWTQIGALGGVDGWSGAPLGPGSEAWAGVTGRRRRTRSTLAASYAGYAQSIAGRVFDNHSADLRVQALTGARPGVRLVASGGAWAPWAEVSLGPVVGPRLAGLSTRLSAGPLMRRGGEGSAMGAITQLAAWTTRPGRWGAGLNGTLRGLNSEIAPAWTADISGSVRRNLGRSARLMTWTGVGFTGQGGPSVLGLNPGGTELVYLGLAAERTLRQNLALRLQLSAESSDGAAGYTRGRVLVGARWLGSRRKLRDPVPGEVRFSLHAPRATEVQLLCSCNGWEPLPMLRERGQWWVTRSLPVGDYEYSYLVDGVPLVPPEAERIRADGFGGTNGLLVVRPAD